MSYNTEYYRNNKEKISKQRRTNKQYKEQKTIICRICTEKIGIKGISLHLQRLHKIDFKEYLTSNIKDFKEYGWKLCPECKLNYTKKNTCSKKCGMNLRSKKYSGVNSGWYGKSHSDSTKLKISKTRTHQGSPWLIGFTHTEETKQKMSDVAKQRAAQPDYINPMQGKTHTEEALRKIFNKRSFTKPELKVQQMLENAGYVVTPQWFLHDDNGNTYSYDFCLTDLKILIEVDGDYWHGGPGVTTHWSGVEMTKKTDDVKNQIANQHNYKIIRLWESEININEQIIINKIVEVL